MSKTIKSKGSCLCGAVKITANKTNPLAGICHCSKCRKWGGASSITVDCGTDITFVGEENISIFDSSEWAERGFCKKCGSHLFGRLKKTGTHYVEAGILDNESDFKLDHQIFTDEKPSYYSFANETKNMTGEEFFAMYANEN